MKKLLSLLLALLMLLALCASFASCGQDTVDTAIDLLNEVLTEPDTGKESEMIQVVPKETETDFIKETEPVETEPAPAETEPPVPETEPEPEETEPETPMLDINATYDDRDSVALYIHLYGKLPSNYITKKEAESLGWSGGSVEKFAPGKCIGGTYFGNYEGLLPSKKGREYHECDIDTLGKKSRGAKRIIYSNDGLIYYTEDHYETFELLYGEE